MSMTESERYIEIIKSLDCENITSIVCEYNKTGCSDCSFMIAKNKAITALEEVQQYRAIGTVSEFQQLKEKATAKQVRLYIGSDMSCPACGRRLRNYEGIINPYCKFCGQQLER